MKQSRKVSGSWKTLLIIGLILSISLFLVIKTKPNSPFVMNTPIPAVSLLPAVSSLPTFAAVTSTPLPPDFSTHVASTLTAMPTVAPMATSTLKPPQCIFPLGQTTATESTPDEYSFSEPQVVLTDKYSINIVEWLPDNQNVLLMPLELNDNGYYQTIELFNPQTKETYVYATRKEIDALPFWSSGLNAVIYPVMNVLSTDEVNHTYEFNRQMWMSHGSPDNTQLLVDNLSQFDVAVEPGGSQIIYMSDGQIFKQNISLAKRSSVPFNSIQWDYRRESTAPPVSYKMVWRPATSQVFFYSDGNTGGGYTFLLDTNTGDLCELNLGGWAGIARWSSDGRYLAITRATEHYPITFSDLAVLDTVKGNIYSMEIAPKEIPGQHYVGDLVWARDSIHLVAIGYVLPFPPTGRLYDEDKFSGLYLVDFISQKSVHILPEYKFFTGWPGTNLTWSPDGSKLLAACPVNDNPQLCLIPVQTTHNR